MKQFLSVGALLLLGVIKIGAQAPPPITLKYVSPYIAYDGIEAATAEEQSKLTIRLYVNSDAAKIVPFECTGTVKPFECKAPIPNLDIGNNIIRATISLTPDGTQSNKSNTVMIFYAIHQTEIIKNTERQVITVIRCQDGSYAFFRITDAAKMGAIINSVVSPLIVSNIVATTNAIYIFTCLPVFEVK